MAFNEQNNNIIISDETNGICLFCEVVEKYTEDSSGFIVKLSELMIDPMLILFGALIGLWGVYHAYKILVGTGTFAALAHDFALVSIAFLLLGGQGNGLIANVFLAALTVMGSVGSLPFEVIDGGLGANTSHYTGLARLVAYGELGFKNVIDTANLIWGLGNLRNLDAYVKAIVLVLPYFLLLTAFASQVVIAIFRLMLVSAFAPFLVMCFGFSWGRPMFNRGLGLLLSGVLIIFACSASLGLIMTSVSGLESHVNSLQDGTTLSFIDPAFVVPVVLGICGVAFMAEATGIANSITGSFLTNTGPAIITAGVTGAAATAFKSSIAPAKGAFSLAKKGTGAAVSELINRYKNPRK